MFGLSDVVFYDRTFNWFIQSIQIRVPISHAIIRKQAFSLQVLSIPFDAKMPLKKCSSPSSVGEIGDDFKSV